MNDNKDLKNLSHDTPETPEKQLSSIYEDISSTKSTTNRVINIFCDYLIGRNTLGIEKASLLNFPLTEWKMFGHVS